MKKLILIFAFLLFAYGDSEAARQFNFTRCAFTGDPTCLPGQSPPTAAFTASGSNYVAQAADCQKVDGYATVSDAGAASGSMVEKPSGTAYFNGEIVCRGNFSNATYRVKVIGNDFNAGSFIWVKFASTHGVNLVNSTPVNQLTTYQPIQVTHAGATFEVVLNGENAAYIKAVSPGKIQCILVHLASDPTASTDCAVAAPATPDYTVFKLSGSAPTSCADSQFTNANVLAWAGFSNNVETVPSLKILHDASKFYFCFVASDGDFRAPTTANDDSAIFTNNDRIELVWRNSTSTGARDANTFKLAANLQNAKYSANYPNNVPTVAQNLNESCSISLTGDLDSTADDTSYQIFCSYDAGFSITDNMQVRFDVMQSDRDGAGTTSRQSKAPSGEINNPLHWGVWTLSGTTVPGGGDGISPTVGAPSFTNVTVSSFTAQSTVTDTGGASCCTITAKAGTVTGSYASYPLGPFSGSLSSGIGSVSLTGLATDTSHKIRIRACDGAGNCTDSAEGTQATSASTSTIFAKQGGSGTACSFGSKCTVQQAIINSVPGSIIEIEGNTSSSPTVLTGASSMIVPTSGKSGTSTTPITVRCSVAGGCLLDGQNARKPVFLGNNNDWWIIEDINFANSNDIVVHISSRSDNNIVRRFVAWNARNDDNNAVVGIHGNTGNMIEDCGLFGSGRKNLSNSQDGNNTRVRRCWAVWNSSTSNNQGREVYDGVYNSKGAIFENLFATRHKLASCTHVNCTLEPGTLFGPSGGTRQYWVGDTNFVDGTINTYCVNADFFGSLIYNRASQTRIGGYDVRGSRSTDCVSFKDIINYNEPGATSDHGSVLLQIFDGGSSGVDPDGDSCVPTGCSRTAQAFTLINGNPATPPNINTSVPEGWQVTNIAPSTTTTYASIAAANASGAYPFQSSAGTGARLCFRYQNGVLTSTKLWPFPMDFRIKDAINFANTRGDHPHNATFYFGSGQTLTSYIESQWGTIPAACK